MHLSERAYKIVQAVEVVMLWSYLYKAEDVLNMTAQVLEGFAEWLIPLLRLAISSGFPVSEVSSWSSVWALPSVFGAFRWLSFCDVAYA